MIRITSKREGFRRCGIAHSRAAVDYPDDRFSPEEFAVLKAEPMLLVVEIQEQPPEKTASAAERSAEKAEEKSPEVKETAADESEKQQEQPPEETASAAEGSAVKKDKPRNKGKH